MAAGWLAWVAVATCPGTLAAQQSEEEEIAREVEELSERATKRYAEGDYEAAIELLKSAYELRAVPNLLYNIARCHEKAQQWERAIDYYEAFVVEPDIATEDRRQALERIENIREAQDTQQDLAERPERQQREEEAPPPPDEIAEGPSKAPAFTLLAIGAVAAGVGGYFGYAAGQSEEEFETAESTELKRQAQQRGGRQAIIADALYATGALSGVIGAVLLRRALQGPTPSDEATPQSAVRIVPRLSRDSGAVTVRVIF